MHTYMKKNLVRLGCLGLIVMLLLSENLSSGSDRKIVTIIDVLNEINYQTNSYIAGLFEVKIPPTIMHRGQSIETDKVYFKDVIGLDVALKEVSEVADFLKDPTKFKAMGAYIPRGILLEGQPGCGKTLIAKAMANEAGVRFFYESASNFVEMYVGVGASRVRELFDKARNNSPAIIFIDEIDAIGAVERGIGGNAEYRQTLNQILAEMDGFNTDGKILVIAATNYAKALDSALVRAGRFDRIIKINPPNEQARVDLLKYYIGKLPSVANDIDDEFLRKIARATEGLTGVDFKTMVNEAPMIPVRCKDDIVTKKHILAAFERVMEQRKPARQNNFPDVYKGGRS